MTEKYSFFAIISEDKGGKIKVGIGYTSDQIYRTSSVVTKNVSEMVLYDKKINSEQFDLVSAEREKLEGKPFNEVEGRVNSLINKLDEINKKC